MPGAKQFWQRLPAVVRKPLVLIIGSTVVIIGLALLILPGPGWAAIFLGFAILSTEFAFAESVRRWLTNRLKSLVTFVHRIFRH